jgi:hypothetical protein
MPWVESASPSFRARHDSADADDAALLLDSLEHTRERLSRHFPEPAAGFTVVVHRSAASLSMANPMLPVLRLATAPAARRYVAGWGSGNELHVLSPAVVVERASSVPGSREMMLLTGASLYARRVVSENNHDLLRARLPVRRALELRWAWLLEGAARWFSGQVEHARPAIARRLREGPPPSFPPRLRDATLLGGTVIDLLAREEGESAAAAFTTRLHPQGSRPALAKAFHGRPFLQTEQAWRSHLGRLTARS